MARYPRRRRSRSLDLRALQEPRPPSSQRTSSPLPLLTDLNVNPDNETNTRSAARSSQFRPAKTGRRHEMTGTAGGRGRDLGRVVLVRRSPGSPPWPEGFIYSDPGHDQQVSLGPFGLPRTRGRAQETSRHPRRAATPRTTGQLLTSPLPSGPPHDVTPPTAIRREPWGPVWLVRIPHGGRGGAAGRAPRRKTWSRPRSEVFVPFRHRRRSGGLRWLLWRHGLELPILGQVDPHSEVEFTSEQTAAMDPEIAFLLERESEQPQWLEVRSGAARRGLLRLREMARWCAAHEGSRIAWSGD
jgi:hypothetical protein